MSRPASKCLAPKCVVLGFRCLSWILILSIFALWFGCSRGRAAAAPTGDQPTTAGATSTTGQSTASGKDGRKDERFSAATDQVLNQRREEIRSEIRTLGDHPWAGEYYEGDGLGVNITVLVAPTAGFVYDFRSDVGPVDRNYGTVTFQDGKIHLSCTLDNNRQRQGIEEEFVPVTWGDRRYLIPPDRVEAFCNDVNSGREPRAARKTQWLNGGAHLLRRGDHEKAVEGLPELPAEYRGLLFEKPVASEILGVTSSTTRLVHTYRDYVVEVRGGKEDGLTSRTYLHVSDPKSALNETVWIRKVGDRTSEGMMSVSESNPGREAPAVGWKLCANRNTYVRDREGGDFRRLQEIETEIVAIESSTARPVMERTSWVQVHGGRDVGLRPGMELFVDPPQSSYFPGIKITQVGENTSEGVITSSGTTPEPPETGWKLSTQSPWRTDAVKSRSKE